jgi:hypothetical protein
LSLANPIYAKLCGIMYSLALPVLSLLFVHIHLPFSVASDSRIALRYLCLQSPFHYCIIFTLSGLHYSGANICALWVNACCLDYQMREWYYGFFQVHLPLQPSSINLSDIDFSYASFEMSPLDATNRCSYLYTLSFSK